MTMVNSGMTANVLPVTNIRRRVLIVDDHPIVRQGLKRMIDAEEEALI